MTDHVRIYWRRYGKGRRLRATWPGGWCEGSPGEAEDAVWDMAYVKADGLGLSVVDETSEVTA